MVVRGRDIEWLKGWRPPKLGSRLGLARGKGWQGAAGTLLASGRHAASGLLWRPSDARRAVSRAKRRCAMREACGKSVPQVSSMDRERLG